MAKKGMQKIHLWKQRMLLLWITKKLCWFCIGTFFCFQRMMWRYGINCTYGSACLHHSIINAMYLVFLRMRFLQWASSVHRSSQLCSRSKKRYNLIIHDFMGRLNFQLLHADMQSTITKKEFERMINVHWHWKIKQKDKWKKSDNGAHSCTAHYYSKRS